MSASGSSGRIQQRFAGSEQMTEQIDLTLRPSSVADGLHHHDARIYLLGQPSVT